ncbi:MAG: hypothetical protein KAT58_13050 [candidate division Zixibacteria bacterium]|nr:hypothetical protein [candidate division Zixibacteria bacterium]
MRNNKMLKRIFPFIALLLLLPWPVAYAYDVVNDTADQDTIRIEIAEDSVKPSFTAFGKAIGGVPPGDLFYIDATNNPADIVTTIYLNNAQDLIGHYTFLILKVGVYVENDGNWEKAYGSNGELISEIVLSMRNGQVSFLLPGYANYKVTIDGGSFYCHNASGDDSTLSPQLYLEVN